MKSRLLLTNACILFVLTVPTFADETESSRTPSHFANLLQVGQTVLLRPSTTHPVYLIQLLSDDQAAELRASFAKYKLLRNEYEEFDAKQKTAKDINTRAMLVVKRQSLESAINDISSIVRLEVYAHQITHVGEDFVTMTRPGKEKYLPLRSIRELYRNDSLTNEMESRSRRRSSNEFALQRTTRLQLRNAKAAAVAELIKKFYPDTAGQIEVDEPANMLLISGAETNNRQLKDFIDALDAEVPDTNGQAEKRRS